MHHFLEQCELHRTWRCWSSLVPKSYTWKIDEIYWLIPLNYNFSTMNNQEKRKRHQCVQYFGLKTFSYSKLYILKIKNKNIQSNFWIILMKSWNTSWNTHFIYCSNYLMLFWANLLIFWLESWCQSFILPLIN